MSLSLILSTLDNNSFNIILRENIQINLTLNLNEYFIAIGTNIQCLYIIMALGYIYTNSFYYFIIFIDDLSRYGHLFLMKNKIESFEKFKEFKARVENQTGKSIKTL